MNEAMKKFQLIEKQGVDITAYSANQEELLKVRSGAEHIICIGATRVGKTKQLEVAYQCAIARLEASQANTNPIVNVKSQL